MGAGAAAAAVGADGTAPITHTTVDISSTTTTESAPSTTTSTSTTTTTPTTAVPQPVTAPPVGALEPTTTIAPIPLARAGELTGSLTLAGTTLIADQPSPVTLSVRNATDHPVSLASAPDAMELGVSLDGYDISTTTSPDAASPVFNQPGDATLAVGEERVFRMTITPPPEMVGAATMTAALLQFFMEVEPAAVYVFAGVPSIPIMAVPPGNSPGQPLDPALGNWKAVLSADSTEVAAGDVVLIHADVTNVGTAEQTTSGYGSLALACGGLRDSTALEEQFAPAATVAVGATQSLSLRLQAREFMAGQPLICWVGIAFHPYPADLRPTRAVDSDSVSITVLPSAPTTTSAPATTTTSTTP
jgi:hypothetical protein